MEDQALANIVVTVLILAYQLRRQLTARPLRDRSIISEILILAGLAESTRFVSEDQPSAGDVTVLMLSLAVGVALAAVRALWTVRLWVRDGRTMRQGTALTAVLWVVSLGQHLAVEWMVKTGSGTTILLYFGVVSLVQREVLKMRARRSLDASLGGVR